MMKCSNCGCEINAYKEIRQAMVNEGFDREYLKGEIDKVIESSVKSAVGDAIDKYVLIAVQRKVDSCLYDRTVQDAIKHGIGNALKDKFIVQVKPSKGE